MWKMVPSCHLWWLWRERNDIYFKDREKTLEELKSLFFYIFIFLCNWGCLMLLIIS